MSFIIQWVEGCSGDAEVSYVQTPVGTLEIVSRQGVVINIDWLIDDTDNQRPISIHKKSFQKAIAKYWLGTDNTVSVTLLKQGSPFSNRVWAEMCRIPFGEILTYAGLAKKVGSSARAVGNACRANPYPLFIPCHRVISVSNMGGYCGQTEGGFMDIKRKLLAFEAAHKK